MTPDNIPSKKPVNKYILYGMIIVGGVVALAIGFYLWSQSSNPGQTGLNQCETNANSVYQQYLTQYQAFQTQNKGQALSQEQETQLTTMFVEYQSAESQCNALASQLQLEADFANPIYDAIAIAILAVGGITAVSIYKRLKGRVTADTDAPADLPAINANLGRNSLDIAAAQDGSMSVSQASARVSATSSTTNDYVASDETTYGDIIQQLQIVYAENDAILENLQILEAQIAQEAEVNAAASEAAIDEVAGL